MKIHCSLVLFEGIYDFLPGLEVLDKDQWSTENKWVSEMTFTQKDYWTSCLWIMDQCFLHRTLNHNYRVWRTLDTIGSNSHFKNDFIVLLKWYMFIIKILVIENKKLREKNSPKSCHTARSTKHKVSRIPYISLLT